MCSFPFSLKPSKFCADVRETRSIAWQLCSTTWRKLVHLQENLCRNAVASAVANQCVAHACATPCGGRSSAAWPPPTRSTSWATGWGSSPSRCSSSTRPDSALATAAALPRDQLPARPAGAAPGRAGRAARRRASRCRCIYCGEAAAFGGLALLAGNFSLAAVVVARRDRRRPGADRPVPDPRGGRRRCSSRRASCAPATPCSTSPSPAAPRSARRSPAWSSPASACSRRCCSTRSPSTRSPGSCCTAGPLPQAEPEPGRMRERVRAGIAYIREQVDAAAAAGRAGRRLRLLRRRAPDRGDLRQGDARRRRLRLRPAAGQLGRRDGARQRRLRRRAARARCRSCSSSARSRSAPATWAWPRRPTLAVACAASVLGGAGNGVQWVAVISAVQELTARRDAGAGDQRARVDRGGDAGARLRCSAA